MKILNLYAGLGGNRSLWEGVSVTAVEIDPEVCSFYQSRFLNDEVINADAHEFLLNHYHEFDFIWSSFPCTSHSRARYWASKGGGYDPKYPDFRLYEEVVFLQHFCEDKKWVVENVTPYYKPLLNPIKIGRHLFWSNFEIITPHFEGVDIQAGNIKGWEKFHGVSLKGYKFKQRKDKLLRNCVSGEIGLHILNESKRIGMFTF